MVRMSLRLTETLAKYLTEKSKQTGLSKNALVLQACWEFIGLENKNQNEKLRRIRNEEST